MTLNISLFIWFVYFFIPQPFHRLEVNKFVFLKAEIRSYILLKKKKKNGDMNYAHY